MDLTVIEKESITSRIFGMRGVKFMLDRDLAELYQIETKYLNKSVSRNIERFPESFMFQLTLDFHIKDRHLKSRW